MWQAVASIASLVTALCGGGAGIVAFVRSAQKGRIDYLHLTLQAQQDHLTRQEGEIGELRGQLKTCHDERQEMARQIAELQRRTPS
jgi:hypothetical protein